MKLSRWLRVSAVAGFLAMGFVSSSVGAQAISNPVVIVIDVQEVMRDAKATKGIVEYRDKLTQQYLNEFSAEENKLRNAEQELVKQQSTLSPEAFGEKRREFETQAGEFSRKVQTRRRNLDIAFNTAMTQVAEAMDKVVRDIAVEHKANLVLPRSQLLFFDTKMDFSKQALEKLNVAVKEVTFPDPAKDMEPKKDGAKGAAPAAPKDKAKAK